MVRTKRPNLDITDASNGRTILLETITYTDDTRCADEAVFQFGLSYTLTLDRNELDKLIDHLTNVREELQ